MAATATATAAGAFPVVALVSSAGGLDALSRVLTPLPVDFPAAVIALQHLAPGVPSRLAEILASRTVLAVEVARDGAALLPGRALVAPAGRHVLVGADARVRLIDISVVPSARPSADLLLATLAVALGPRVVAVVLTGRGADGALGAQAVHAFGGRVLVQDEESAQEAGMPHATALVGHPLPPLPLDAIAAALQAMVRPS